MLIEIQVRFQHEVYPDNTFEASRQVLAIGDIEIRDRLAHSHINKFLYQYCSEARPRQAHANMVLVKALHVRPDQHVPALECSLKVIKIFSEPFATTDVFLLLRNRYRFYLCVCTLIKIPCSL